MDVTFSQLTVGSVAAFTFKLTSIDVGAMTATMDLISVGQIVGSATVDLAASTADVTFTQLATSVLTVVSQTFQPGDLIRQIGSDVVLVSWGMDPADDTSVWLDDDGSSQAPSDQFVRVGHIDLATLSL